MRDELLQDAANCCRQMHDHSYEPRACRYPADRLLWLVRADGSVSCATMTNVSRDGFGLKVTKAPDVGERVILRGGPGDVPAEIRWSTGDRAGGVFVIPNYN